MRSPCASSTGCCDEEGLFLGSTSGINVAAAVRVALALGPGHRIVTVLCDGGAKYLSRLFNRLVARAEAPAELRTQAAGVLDAGSEETFLSRDTATRVDRWPGHRHRCRHRRRRSRGLVPGFRARACWGSRPTSSIRCSCGRAVHRALSGQADLRHSRDPSVHRHASSSSGCSSRSGRSRQAFTWARK